MVPANLTSSASFAIVSDPPDISKAASSIRCQDSSRGSGVIPSAGGPSFTGWRCTYMASTDLRNRAAHHRQHRIPKILRRLEQPRRQLGVADHALGRRRQGAPPGQQEPPGPAPWRSGAGHDAERADRAKQANRAAKRAWENLVSEMQPEGLPPLGGISTKTWDAGASAAAIRPHDTTCHVSCPDRVASTT